MQKTLRDRDEVKKKCRATSSRTEQKLPSRSGVACSIRTFGPSCRGASTKTSPNRLRSKTTPNRLRGKRAQTYRSHQSTLMPVPHDRRHIRTRSAGVGGRANSRWSTCKVRGRLYANILTTSFFTGWLGWQQQTDNVRWRLILVPGLHLRPPNDHPRFCVFIVGFSSSADRNNSP